MKKYFLVLQILSASTAFHFTSCKKPGYGTISGASDPLPPPSYSDLNREYYWGRQWRKDSNDYEIKIEASRLTDSALNKGIKVYVAIYSDWSFFEQMPLTLNDADLPDTANLSFNAMPGSLQIIARAPFVLNWSSDILIEYE
jgi:hypothetical protein